MTFEASDDWDLAAAIQGNQPGITVKQIADVLAVVYGEHDESSYYWVLRLTDGTVGMLQGWHDYTGWDCRSDATWTPAPTPEAAAELASDDNNRPVKGFLREQLAGVPPEKSAYQIAMERMGFPKDVS